MPSAPPLSEISGSAPDLYWKELLEVVQFYIYRLSRLLSVRLSRVCLFVSLFFAFSSEKVFSVVFLLYDAFVFQKAESMTRGCWPTLDYFITCSYTLHHPEGDPCESWGSGISFKGVTSRAIEKCFLTPAMQAFNSCMSHVRIAVEWLSGDTANYLSL